MESAQKRDAEMEIDFNGESFESESNLPTATNSAEKTNPVEDEEQKLLRSVFVKNVDYSATNEDLKAHFQECSGIERITIGKNKVTQRPLGYAYI